MASVTGSPTPTRPEPMLYRRRLRSRIIVSFLLLGFGLTAAFALASLALRTRLEGQLLDNTLRDEANSLNVQVRSDPDRQPSFSFFDAGTVSDRNAWKLPLELQALPTGVHDVVQADSA